jgi:hypothetical protein
LIDGRETPDKGSVMALWVKDLEIGIDARESAAFYGEFRD